MAKKGSGPVRLCGLTGFSRVCLIVVLLAVVAGCATTEKKCKPWYERNFHEEGVKR